MVTRPARPLFLPDMIQVNPVASEEDVFQYVSQSLVAFEQVV
ncbi:unnamed protein product, partial [Ectocarpus sp. 12 AP-2014]